LYAVRVIVSQVPEFAMSAQAQASVLAGVSKNFLVRSFGELNEPRQHAPIRSRPGVLQITKPTFLSKNITENQPILFQGHVRRYLPGGSVTTPIEDRLFAHR
jgi:hypothetical protein